MRAKGALHVHSDLSHDGKMSLPCVAEFYRSRGYSFVAMGEHSQDMSADSVKRLVTQCASLSDAGFCMIPGIEFTCTPTALHVLGVGVVQLTSEVDPVRVAQHISGNDGFVILAHPSRLGWAFSPELWDAVHAVEVWNVGYDGKYFPRKDALAQFQGVRHRHPHLMAVGSHDLHQPGGYYEVTVEMQVAALSRDAILAQLHSGQFQIASRWFHCESNGYVRRREQVYLGMLGPNLVYARRLRRWLSRVGA
jgi:hypothetical protein